MFIIFFVRTHSQIKTYVLYTGWVKLSYTRSLICGHKHNSLVFSTYFMSHRRISVSVCVCMYVCVFIIVFRMWNKKRRIFQPKVGYKWIRNPISRYNYVLHFSLDTKLLRTKINSSKCLFVKISLKHVYCYQC